MSQENKQFAEVGRTRNEELVPLWVLKAELARTYNASLASDVEVALNASASMISITVIDAPVFMKAKTATGGTAVSSSNFTRLLGVGQHDFFRGQGITHLSFIQQSAGAVIAVSEFNY